MSTIIKQSVNRVSIRLRECNSKRQIFITLNDEDVLLFSHQTISMKHHLTETHKQACKIRNIVSILQSIFSGKYDRKGCSFSMATFILALEPLLNKIRCNPSIPGSYQTITIPKD